MKRLRINDRWWPAIAVAMLLPLWFIGMFGRGYWTPDEPREADIAWHMKSQEHRALPQLGGKPFMEKPPLTYWMTAGAMQIFGDSPAAARLPNLLYAVIAVLAIGLLAEAMAGRAAALSAAILAGSALLSWRVAVWVAPDAALVAGCAVGLLGAWRGYTAAPGRGKLFWYTLMHVGALAGFMAKSAPGWIVPALALLVLIVWERRWRELLRWELYAGFVLQALVIGSWVRAVWLGPDGATALRVLFWNNLMGRFTHVDAPAQFNYAQGHQNWPAKYFVQLPTYLYPWTLLALAALLRAWKRLRAPSAAPPAPGAATATATATAWRFALSACLPFLLLLSLASTARDVYAAPAVAGFALLIALWIDDCRNAPGAFDRWALRYTAPVVALVGLLCALVLLTMAFAQAWVGWPQVLVVVAAMLVSMLWLLARAEREQRHHRLHDGLLWTYAAFAVPVVIAAQLLFPAIDRVQNLPALAAQVRTSLGAGRLALLDPDETTIAMMNIGRSDLCDVIDSGGADAGEAARHWFARHDAADRILVKLPGRADGPLTPLVRRFSHPKPPGDGIAGQLQQAGAATLIVRLELPHGRRYALLGPGPRVLAVR